MGRRLKTTRRLITAPLTLALLATVTIGCFNVTGSSDVPMMMLVYMVYGFDQETGECKGGVDSVGWNRAQERAFPPSAGYYCVGDDAYMKEAIAQMKSIGVDTLLLSWNGWGDVDFDGRIKAKDYKATNDAIIDWFADLSEDEPGIKAAVVAERFFEVGDLSMSSEDVTSAQKQQVRNYIWDNIYRVHPSAVFHWEGKPLLVSYGRWLFDDNPDSRFTLQEWGVIHEGGDWEFTAHLGLDGMKTGRDGAIWVAPRFDQFYIWATCSGFKDKEPNTVVRFDIDLSEGLYDRTWRKVFENRNQVKMIILYGWNPWAEASSIEPAAPYGDLLLRKTAWYHALFDADQPFVPYPQESSPAREPARLAALMYLWYGFNLTPDWNGAKKLGDSTGGLGSSHWNTPGRNSAHRRGVTDEPVYGFYASDDPDVIAQQLSDMEKAGISVIFISWWGSGDTNLDGVIEEQPLEPNSEKLALSIQEQEAKAMARAAKVLLTHIRANSSPFQVAILVEPYMPDPPDMTTEQKQAILDELWDTVYSAYPDLVLHWEGKPLVVTWSPVDLKETADPRYTIKTWGSYFDGPDWKPESGQDWNWYPEPAWQERMISDDGVYVVHPRFDEFWLNMQGRKFEYPYRRVDPWLTQGVYEWTWQVAVDNSDKIGLIVLNSWNEHKEHTAIESDKGESHMGHGDRLLHRTAAYYGQFKSGLPIVIDKDSWTEAWERREKQFSASRCPENK